MLCNKVTTKISELQKFFTSDEKIFQTLLSVFNTLNLSGNQFRTVGKSNSKYVGYQRFVLLILFSLFDIKHMSDYRQSPLYKLFNGGKDIFYRFINNSNFSWRKLACQVNKRLVSKDVKSSYKGDNKQVKCLIVDDTDLPKSGRHIEFFSRIYSHVTILCSVINTGQTLSLQKKKF